MPDRVVQDFPIFPLDLVALPREFVRCTSSSRATAR
jgi:hypothetical protein